MRGFTFGHLLLVSVISLASGQRWVWGSRRSGRQLELHRPSSSSSSPRLPTAAPPDAPPAPPAASPPAFPPAAPFGLIPSESSLNPHGRPAALESSFSASLVQSPVSPAPFQLRPRPLEPLVFRPLPIDISKLPLESSSEGENPLEGEFHPPLVPQPLLSREADPLDFTRSFLPLPRPGGPFETIAGVHADAKFPRDISNINIRAPPPFRQSQAFVTPPDISVLPLQVTSADDRERFENLPFADRPGPLAKFRLDSPVAPTDNHVFFPLKISSLEALETSNDRLLQHHVTPNPTRVFLQDRPIQDNFPFRDANLENAGLFSEDNPRDSALPTPRGTIKFPKDVKKFSFRGSLPEQQPDISSDAFGSGSTIGASSYAFPPPGSGFGFQPSRDVSGFLRTERSDSPSVSIKKPEPKLIKPQTLTFKKHFNKVNRVPARAWFWPGDIKARQASSSFSSPAKHAL